MTNIPFRFSWLKIYRISFILATLNECCQNTLVYYSYRTTGLTLALTEIYIIHMYGGGGGGIS